MALTQLLFHGKLVGVVLFSCCTKKKKLVWIFFIETELL